MKPARSVTDRMFRCDMTSKPVILEDKITWYDGGNWSPPALVMAGYSFCSMRCAKVAAMGAFAIQPLCHGVSGK